MRLKHTSKSGRSSSPEQEGRFRRNAGVPSRLQRQTMRTQQVASQRLITQEHAVLRRRRFVWVAIFGVFVLGVIFIQRMSLRTVQIDPSDPLNAQESAVYQATIDEYLGENVPLRQSWLLDTTNFKEYIQKKHPEISQATTSTLTPIKDTLTVRIALRKPLYRWQDVAKEARYVDSQGVLFSARLSDASQKRLIQIDDQSGAVLESGSSALSQDVMGLIGALPVEIKSVYSNKTEVSKVIIPSSTREVRVALAGGVKYYMKLSTERTLGAQMGELRALLTHLAKKKVTPREYIDLRLQGRAFYK